MSIENVGSGPDPSRFPSEKGNSQESSSSSKKTRSLWSKIKGSQEDVSSKITSESLSSRSRASGEEKLRNLTGKTEDLSSTAAKFLETTKKLEALAEKQAGIKTSKKGYEFLKEKTGFEKGRGLLFDKESRRNLDSSSSRSRASREEKLRTLEEKAKDLSSTAVSFKETTKKLEEKYRKQANLEISKKVHKARKQSPGFLSFIKEKLQISKKQEDSSVSSTDFEEATGSEEVISTLECLEQFESDIKEEAETAEAVNSCLDDCCGCLKKLRSLFKRETHTRKRSKNSCCEKFKKSLLKIRESITETTDSIKKAIKKRVRLNSVSFKQKVYKKALRELLKTGNLEDRTSVTLFGIKSLAQITGFDCKFSKNGISFVPRSGEEIFFSRLQLFSKLVDELLVDVDEIDPQIIEVEEIQNQFELVVKELSSYSNYFWHLFGLFY